MINPQLDKETLLKSTLKLYETYCGSMPPQEVAFARRLIRSHFQVIPTRLLKQWQKLSETLAPTLALGHVFGSIARAIDAEVRRTEDTRLYHHVMHCISRGLDGRPLPGIDSSKVVDHQSARIVSLYNALDALAVANPMAHKVVHLRFYAAYTLEEIGEILSLSMSQVRRLEKAARSYLKNELMEAS